MSEVTKKSEAKKRAGIDRSYGKSLGAKVLFFFLHGIGVGLSAYLVLGGGVSAVGGWLGQSWQITEPLRAQWMFAAVVLYWLRHGITLFYLLQRKVELSEVLGLSVFLILLEPTFCLLASGVTKSSVTPFGWLAYVSLGLIVLGSYLNTCSEVQRKWWKADPEHRGKCYTEGLFRYSMHINYFGDSVSFTGWALLTGVGWALILPLGMTAGFLFFHIPGLDSYLEERYGDEFRDYAKRTKKLIPFLY